MVIQISDHVNGCVPPYAPCFACVSSRIIRRPIQRRMNCWNRSPLLPFSYVLEEIGFRVKPPSGFKYYSGMSKKLAVAAMTQDINHMPISGLKTTAEQHGVQPTVKPFCVQRVRLPRRTKCLLHTVRQGALRDRWS